MEYKPDIRKQCLVNNILQFLEEELLTGNMNDEKKESVEVAMQCLETAFEIDDEARKLFENERVDLLSLIKIKPKIDVSEDIKQQAEQCKTLGNTHMKNGLYKEAAEEYSKAINLNPYNAIYFCNRAAAYSRLEKHNEVINDCKEAIKLDPTYGKAYGRLGIAYSHLNKYEEARQAYTTALKYDPNNQMYETNLKLAEERLFTAGDSAAPPEHRPLDISQFINNPALINMATQMLGDPNFRNIISGVMSMNETDNPNLDVLLQAGQTLASRMQSSNPNLVENLRRSFNPGQQGQGSSDGGSGDPPSGPGGSGPDDKKEQ